MSRCLCCKKLREPNQLSECVQCAHSGPYCKKCTQCAQCESNHPGDWTCGDSDHQLKRGEFRAKCITCDEFDYCMKCVTKCPCGKGETHYLCKSYRHECIWHNENDTEQCRVRVCEKYCGIEDLTGEIRLFCPSHKPRISKRLREIVLSEKDDK